MVDAQGRDDATTPASQTAAEARAEYEARRAETRELREQKLSEAFPDGDPGAWLTTTGIFSTIVFAVVTLAAAVDPDRFIVPFFVVAVILFTIGTVAFALVVMGMALRSRDDQLSVAGVFFLAGSAPRQVQARMIGSFAVQIVVALTGAALRPFTPLAAGTLVPLLGLAVMGLWAVRYGHFEPHEVGDTSRSAS